MVKQNTTKVACCSRRQKIWGVIALAGLFACGLMVGLAFNAGGRSSTVELAANTNDTEPDTADKETCEVIEDFLMRRTNPIDSDQVTAHSMNVEIYQILIENGCPENSEKYQALMQQESAILDILINRQMPENSQTCSEIQSLLMQKLPNGNLNDCQTRIERAKIYANLSERGCPENSQQYAELAAKELEIARALRDDYFNRNETLEVVETYKRLEMKQAAADVLDKVQKLTDPAIDFIIQVQKIIEE